MKIKIFKSYLSETTDTNSIESKVNAFISSKKVIDIKQSVSPFMKDGGTALSFTVITVMYEDK